MRSQAYVSKRRLTNICCFVVGLGLVKLVFGIYIIAGGTIDFSLLNFSKEKQVVDPKMQALENERQKQFLAIKEANARLVMENPELAVRQAQEQMPAQQSPRAESIASQNTDNAGAIAQQTNQPKQAVQMAENHNGVQNNSIQNISVNPGSIQFDSVQHDGVQADMLIKASKATIGSMQAKNRHAVLENNFAAQISENSAEQAELSKALEEVQANYKEKSLFSFSLVGTAHAQEIDAAHTDPSSYARPDQSLTSTHIPAPTIANPYNSPSELSYREAELNQKEEELLHLQEQMDSRMKELNALENQLGDMVKEATSVEDGKYDHLIKTYSTMKPRKAAEILLTMDEQIAVRILNGMKSKVSGEIFSYMDTAQAARLSKAMTKLAD